MSKEIEEKIYNLRTYLGTEENWLLNDIQDYITNLQEENQKLLKICADYDKQANDYKSRVEKAVEYIEEEFDRTGVCVSGSDLPYSYIEDLLNILQGAEDSNLH